MPSPSGMHESPSGRSSGSAGRGDGVEDDDDDALEGNEGVAAAQFLSRLQVVPYGVLGVQLAADKRERRRAALPDDATAFVDAAGLPYIQEKGPSGASGAAGAIYKHVGINTAKAFPDQVVQHVAKEGDARLYSYGDQHVIHAVGPDFRQECYIHADDEEVLEERCMRELTQAYTNVLREYAEFRLPRAMPYRHLRLLPLSGGIFSGQYAEQLPGMTMGALGAGFSLLKADEQQRILGSSSIVLCIFMEAELSKYSSTLKRVQDALHLQGVVPSTSVPSHDSFAEADFEAHALCLYSNGYEPALGNRPGTGLAKLRASEEFSPRKQAPECTEVSTMADVKAVVKKKAAPKSPKYPTRQAKPWDAGGVGVPSEGEPDEAKGLHFDSFYKSMTVKISPDHISASWSLSRYGGMVMASKPLRKRVFGRWFEVQVDEVDEGRWNDGLGIGVAAKPPKEHFKFEMNALGQFEGMACELLPDSWLLGYDGGRARIKGRSRYLTSNEMPDGVWRPSTLRAGDVVGLLITPEGHLFLFVNDVLKLLVLNGEGLEKLGRTLLYATLDLDGCTKTVHFLDTNGLPSLKVQQIHAKFREEEYSAKVREGKVDAEGRAKAGCEGSSF